MTGIGNGHGFAIERVCEVPLVGVGHVITLPTFQHWRAPQKFPFDVINRSQRIMDVAFVVGLIIGVAIFLGHITIKGIDFSRSAGLDNVLHISPGHRCNLSPFQWHCTIPRASNHALAMDASCCNLEGM